MTPSRDSLCALPLIISSLFLVSCGESAAEKEAKALFERQKSEVYVKGEAARNRQLAGEKDAIKLSDRDLQKLIESCKSEVFKWALKNSATGHVAMVESESAAQFVLSAGNLAMVPADSRVSMVRLMQSKESQVYINMHYAVVSSVPAAGKEVTEYRCKLAPGPVLDGVEKVIRY